MKMLSKPEGLSKMMKAVQGLTGMGGGASGGGPLFGGGQSNAGAGAKSGGMPPFGLDPSNMPSKEEMERQMKELEQKLPPDFKKRF